MQRFTALDLQRKLGPVQEAALREPVAITHHGRDRLVMMAADEYARLKRRDKMVVAAEDIPDDFLSALEAPYTDAEQSALDGEIT
ncbi:type II toxin-antitoxin system Phd/YefM family antitoxin [Azospirillum sp. TSO35-2]|uniref:type II toxin-antitoxin system Phd/YefM family antitoxin n=1 Tax=Azospirillum sp. TSO35-2 TaxID=716796 RepID=UPI000D60CDC5|nr:type II toxin-antitoxin system Phd/YefM family antitoxin [Azospirillum sp. TSO35-2]PWC33137.1 hypothetical protein TSO352_21640 [Azospirillum sp. TSO35-2]